MEVLDMMRLPNDFWVVVAGFVVVAAITLAAMSMTDDDQQVSAIVTSVTGLVGAVVGAYLGVMVGSNAGDKMTKMALMMDKMSPEEASHFMADTVRR
jgi:uncharacterized membrane protein YeaQ/YmgE (transglycosylase-associated protein family)